MFKLCTVHCLCGNKKSTSGLSQNPESIYEALLQEGLQFCETWELADVYAELRVFLKFRTLFLKFNSLLITFSSWKTILRLNVTYNPRQKSLKQTPLLLNFLEKSWDLLLTNLFSLWCALSLPNVEPRVFWSTETAVMPKSTLGKGKRTQMFQDFWRGL